MSTVDKTTNKPPATSSGSIAALYASAASVTVYWISIIIKEAYAGFSDILNFYKPVGPLLGLFILALLTFFVVYYAINSSLSRAKTPIINKHLQKSVTLFVISTVLVFFMTFPPIFDWFVELLK